MTVETPKNKRGKVKPPARDDELVLNIDPTYGAYLDYLEAAAALFTAEKNQSPLEMIAALKGLNQWLVEYAGITMEQLRGLSMPEVKGVFEQSRRAFGDAEIPK